jgi:hypothetical protein
MAEHSAAGHNKRMVSPYPTVESRLQHVMETCRYPSTARFMDAVGEKPQQWRNWVMRDSLGRAYPKVKAATGASIDWLMTGEGEPFPEGAIPYNGPQASADLLARIVDLERDIVDVVSAMSISLERFSATTPDAGKAVAADLRAYLSRPGRPSAVLPELLRAIERAASPAAPAAGGKKSQRSK